MLKNDTLKNGTSRIDLYGNAPGVYLLWFMLVETKLAISICGIEGKDCKIKYCRGN